MKILMCNSFNYLRGGAERCFLALSDLLRSHGHTVIPFCMQDERNLPSPYGHHFVSHIDFPSELQKAGVRPKLRVLERVLYSREAKQRITDLIRETTPDIAHIHGIAHETSPSILAAIKAAQIPIIQTLHDYKLLCPNTSFVSQGRVCENCKSHRYFNVITQRCKRDSFSASLLAGIEMYTHKLLQIYEKNVDVFVSPSEFLQRKVVEYGIKNTVLCLPNFIEAQEHDPCYEPEDYFVYCGRLVQEKGVTTLLNALKHIRASHLYIAGNGDQADSLQAYVHDEQINNVTFLGHMNSPDLFSLVRRAAFTVVPSEWYENYSMTVLESYANGTPVIGANIGGIPEQIKDGINGLLFEPGNAVHLAEKIQFMLDHRRQAIDMGRHGRRQVEAVNSPEKHYHQTMEIYQQLCPHAVK